MEFKTKWLTEIKRLVKSNGHFSLLLNDYGAHIPISNEQCLAFLKQNLLPVLQKAHSCHLFRFEWPRDRAIPKAYIQNKGRSTQINVSDARIYADVDFWLWLLRSNAVVLIGVNQQEVNFSELFRNTWDPDVIVNLRSSIGPSPLTLARSQCQNNQTICLSVSLGFDGYLHVFADPLTAGDLFEMALLNCQFTSIFKNQNTSHV